MSRPRKLLTSSRLFCWRWLGAWIHALCVACSPQEHLLATVTSGSSDAGVSLDADAGTTLDEPGGAWGEPQLLESLSVSGANDQDPSLTADELVIVFTSNRDGLNDLWTSVRTNIDAAWPSPTKVEELSSASDDSNPKISPDGLRLWFASNRAGNAGMDIMVSSRPDRNAAWGAPELIPAANSAASDLCPAPDRTERILVFASTRAGNDHDLYQLRAEAEPMAWGDPVALTEVNSGAQDWDGVLPDDGLVLYFASGRLGSEDIFETRRADVSEPFSEPIPLDVVNTSASEGDPWVSADERHIVYRGDGEDSQDLFEAWR